MPKTYKITEAQMEEIKVSRKTNKDKNVDKRLRAVELRGDGYKNNEIAIKVEAHPTVVSRWICKYIKEGISGLMKGKYVGNNRNLSLDEERKFIDGFKKKAKKGQYVTVKEIKIAY
jgi:transposase